MKEKNIKPIIWIIAGIGIVAIIIAIILLSSHKENNVVDMPVIETITSTENSVSDNDAGDVSTDEPMYSSENQDEWTEEDWEKYNRLNQKVEEDEKLYYDEKTGKLVTYEEYTEKNPDGVPVSGIPSTDDSGNHTIIPETSNSTGTTPTDNDQNIGSNAGSSSSTTPNVSPGTSGTTPNEEAKTCNHTNTYEQVAEGVKDYIAQGSPCSCYTQNYVHDVFCSDCGEKINTYITSEEIHETYTENVQDLEWSDSAGIYVVYDYSYEVCPCGHTHNLINKTLHED